MTSREPTPLQGGLLRWQDLLNRLRALDEREQIVLLDILTIALAREAGRITSKLDERAA